MPENRIDYSSRDYASLLTQLLAKKLEKLPDYTEDSDNDLGIFLIQLFAMLGDMVGYYQDRIACESFLSICSERPSALRLVELIGYTPSSLQSASVSVTFTLSANPSGTTISKGDQVGTTGTDVDPQKIFTTDEDLVIAAPGLSGSVLCSHGSLNVEEFTGDGLPSQSIFLSYSPVVSGKVTVEVDSVEWTEVANLADKVDTDQVYVVLYQEDGTAVVLFGDGVHGKVPPDSSVIDLSYVIGGGVEGRVEASKIDTYLGSIENVSSVTNVTASSGGLEKEGMGSIQVNAPASLKSAGRAVTADDFESVAMAVSGVQQAKAVEYGGYVRVSIVPTGGGLPSAPLKASVLSDLSTKRMRGVHVNVEDPVYIDVDVTMIVVAERGYRESVLQSRVENVVGAFLDPNQTSDSLYIHGYGTDVYLSELYQIVNDIPGVARCSVSTLKRDTAASGVGDIMMRDIEIRSAGTVSISVLEGTTATEFEDQVRNVKRNDLLL